MASVPEHDDAEPNGQQVSACWTSSVESVLPTAVFCVLHTRMATVVTCHVRQASHAAAAKLQTPWPSGEAALVSRKVAGVVGR